MKTSLRLPSLLLGLILWQNVAKGAAIYYVATNGNNSANGTSLTTPWLTISKAAATMVAGDTVYIRGGTYREAIAPANGGNGTNNRITYSAYANEQPVVTGSDIYTNWTSTGTNWVLPWTTNLSTGGNAQLQYRREMVIVDGTVLAQVATLGEVVNGAYYVDGTEGTNSTHIWMRTPDGTAPGGQVVECAWRDPLFVAGTAQGCFHVAGLTFMHDANDGPNGMGIFGAHGSLVESNIFEWSGGTGVRLGGVGNIYNSDLSENNGELGFSGTGTNNLIENCSAYGNNWRGYDVGNEAGGLKIVQTTNTLIRNFTAGNNNGPGVWFDYDVYGSTVEQCLLYSNQLSGVQIEESAWNTIRNCVVWGTRWYSYTAAGFLTMASCSNTIVNCSFINNGGDGVFIKSDTSRHLTNGFNKIFNCLFRDNGTSTNFTGDVSGAEVHVSYAPGDGSEIGNQFNGNIYYHTNVTSDSQTFLRGSPAYFGNSLTNWQSNGYDPGSVMADPLVVDWQSYAGWHLTAASPARGLGVTPPVAVTNDYDGDPRPATGADSGADQYTIGNVSAGYNPLPAPWQNQDIGGVGVAGSAGNSNGTFIVSGSGADIAGAADACQYAYQAGNGNSAIQARVTGVQSLNGWSKAGVMIRETLDADARYAAVLATPSNGICFQWRGSPGGNSVTNYNLGIKAPIWVRLVRTGNSFAGYFSGNGTSWGPLSTQTVMMSSNTCLGLGISSDVNTNLGTATFDNVTVTPWTPRLQGGTLGGGQFSLQALAVEGWTCVLETSTNLITWWPVLTNTTLMTGELVLTNETNGLDRSRFYRVQYNPSN